MMCKITLYTTQAFVSKLHCVGIQYISLREPRIPRPMMYRGASGTPFLESRSVSLFYLVQEALAKRNLVNWHRSKKTQGSNLVRFLKLRSLFPGVAKGSHCAPPSY